MVSIQITVLALLLLATFARSEDDAQFTAGTSARKMPSNGCDRAVYSFNCLKLDAVQFLDKMSTRQVYHIAGGLSLVHDPTANQTQNSEIIAGKSISWATACMQAIAIIMFLCINMCYRNGSQLSERRTESFEWFRDGQDHQLFALAHAEHSTAGCQRY